MVDVLWILKHKIFGRGHYYEQPVMDRLKWIRGEVFVDVGANIGRYSKRLAGNFKTVHAFEPNPRYFQKLLENVGGLNVNIRTCALADFDGKTRLFYRITELNNGADTILKEFRYNPAGNPRAAIIFKGNENQSFDDISCFRFDTLFPKEIVDLVKIDVEGAEFLVLAGMSNAMKEHRVKNLVVELHDSSQESALLKLFGGYGYSSVWLDPTHLFVSVSTMPIKLVAVTPDFERESGFTASEHYLRADREKARLVNLIFNGSIRPGFGRGFESYCDTCKAAFPGNWFSHQKTVHNRILPGPT